MLNTVLCLFPYVDLLLLFILGAVIGSFLNVVILRMPKDETLGGRSHCMHCKHQLAALDLIPVLSYVGLHGKCRYCGNRISPRYAIIETVTGLLFLITAWFFPVLTASGIASPVAIITFIRALFIVSVLVTIFTIDLEQFLILDRILLPACIVLFLLDLSIDLVSGVGLGASITLHGIAAAAGAFLFFFCLYAVARGQLLGFGDVKLGVFLGFATPGLLVALNIFLAYIVGAAVAIPLILLAGKKMKSEVPFGTFLSISTLIVLYCGPQILSWYLRLIGVV